MENRHLPILHKNIPLRNLCVSSESSSEGEWVVRFFVNYSLISVITGLNRHKTEKSPIDLLPEKRKHQRQDDANDDARQDRKVECKLFPFDHDISGKSPDPGNLISDQ